MMLANPLDDGELDCDAVAGQSLRELFSVGPIRAALGAGHHHDVSRRRRSDELECHDQADNEQDDACSPNAKRIARVAPEFCHSAGHRLPRSLAFFRRLGR